VTENDLIKTIYFRASNADLKIDFKEKEFKNIPRGYFSYKLFYAVDLDEKPLHTKHINFFFIVQKLSNKSEAFKTVTNYSQFVRIGISKYLGGL
jgi:hypothetical protein